VLCYKLGLIVEALETSKRNRIHIFELPVTQLSVTATSLKSPNKTVLIHILQE